MMRRKFKIMRRKFNMIGNKFNIIMMGRKFNMMERKFKVNVDLQFCSILLTQSSAGPPHLGFFGGLLTGGGGVIF